MPGRLIAIGDIHGCADALAALLSAVRPAPADCLVTLGDYVDRGPDSRRAIDQLLDLRRQCNLIPLLGNHDQMLLRLAEGDGSLLDDWLSQGGTATLASFGCPRAEEVPEKYLAFLRQCQAMHVTPRHFFLHGNYLADVPLDQQPEWVVYWESLRTREPGPHFSGKTAIVGHTSQRSGEVLDLGYLKCIDTCCYRGLWLTALAPETGQMWQANQHGEIRQLP